MRKLLIILLFPVFAKAQFTLPSTVGFNKPQSAAPLSPKDTAGLLRWVYSDTLGLSDNDPVASLTDLAGSGDPAVQSSSSLKPLYKTNIQNGRAAILFDGSDDFMEFSNTSLTSGLTGMTIFIVRRVLSGGNRTSMAKWDYATDGSWGIQTSDVDNNETMMYVADACNDAGGNHQNSTDGTFSTSNFYVLAYVFDGTQSNANRVKVYSNGTLLSTSTSGTLTTTLTSCSATVKIGKFGGALGRYLDGYVGEILIYDHALTSTGLTTWTNYLKIHWGL